MKGFTLLELIITVGILAVLGAASFNFYYNFQLDVKIDEEANHIYSILRQTQAKAISGEEGLKWGTRFVNPQSGEHYYSVFQGASYENGTTTDTYYLSAGVEFTNPSASSTLDVIFNKRSGSLANSSSTITASLKTSTSDIIKSVSITPSGLINKE